MRAFSLLLVYNTSVIIDKQNMSCDPGMLTLAPNTNPNRTFYSATRELARYSKPEILKLNITFLKATQGTDNQKDTACTDCDKGM